MLHRSPPSRRLSSRPPPSAPKASLIGPMIPRALITAPRPDVPRSAPSLSRPRSPTPHHTHGTRPQHHRFRRNDAPWPSDRAPIQRARASLHPSLASRRAPQLAIALQAALTSATFTTTTTLATARHRRQQHTQHAPHTQSRAQLISVACIVALRAGRVCSCVLTIP